MTLVASVVASALSFGVSASALSPVQTELNAVLVGQGNSAEKATAQVQQQFPTYYIIELEDAPLATYQGGVRGLAPTYRGAYGEEKLNLRSAAAQGYQAYLADRQREFASELSNRFPSAQIERNLNILLNGAVISIPGQVDAKNELLQIPGVKRVYEHELVYAQTDTSLELVNAPEVWELIGGDDARARAGDGVKVAIVDGGIRSEHPMFQDSGHTLPSGLPDDDYCSVIDASFCNDKLAVARYYTPTFAVHPSEHISPLDYGGHGTHVAGTAVGNVVSTTYQGVDVGLSGVAPGATLMVYKALFQTPAGTGSGSNAMLVPALEDAVADGADIVNNSWGGGAGGDPANSVYTPIFEAAEAAGVLMVTAAGNSGNGPQTVGCPACAEPGLAVANTQTGRFFADKTVDGPGLDGVPAIMGAGDFTWPTEDDGTGTQVEVAVEGPLMYSGAIDDTNVEGCAAFPEDSLLDHIAVIPRGTCAFTDKAVNAENAGAIGLIVVDNAATGIISMSMPGANIPSVAISSSDGESLLASWQEGDTGVISPEAQVFIDEASTDIMSASSSRGPNGNASFLKPDVAAPGTNILSAYAPRGGEYNAISGTSMASPHVAGAAALLKQLNPDLNALELKSLLMTSSNQDVLKEDAATDATPFDRGAGRLDIAEAVRSVLTFDKASIASVGCAVSCEFERTVTNHLPTEGTWVGRVEFANAGVTGELSAEEVTIEGEGEATFTLAVDVSYANPGWVFGQVVWEDTSGQYADAHLPIAIMAQRTADSAVLATTVTDAANLTTDAPAAISSRLGASGASLPVSFTMMVPQGTEIDPESITITSARANEVGFSIAQNQRSMTWAGSVTDEAPTTELPVQNFLATGTSLLDISPTSPSLPCTAGCDEILFTFNVGNFGGFEWGGQPVNTIGLTENGLITAGDTSFSESFQNQEMPNAESPNGALAPFWADFEVGGDNGGAIHYNVLSDGTNDWFVYEWNDVARWNDPDGDRYTFAVWINLGTNQVFFNYVDMPATLGTGSVGFENTTGEIGLSAYYNGSGFSPVSNSSHEAILAQGETGFIQFDYEVTPTSIGTADDLDITVLENESIAVDMSTVFELGLRTLSETRLDSDVGEWRAVQPMNFAAVGDGSIEIVSAPVNGTIAAAEVAEGEEADPFAFVYTPEADFVGSDSFTYRVVDANGLGTSTATVSVIVENSNTAPTASATAPASAAFNTGVTLNGSASSDPEGDTLTFEWAQLSGPNVTLSNANAASASFTVPALATQGTAVFELTVSDGEFSDSTTVSVTLERKPSSDKWYEGHFGGLLLLLAFPLLFVRRRRKA